MGTGPCKTYEASENINVSRFVSFNSSNDWTVDQAGANARVIGVSVEHSKDAPIPSATDLAAESGDQIQVYTNSSYCFLEAGASVTRGEFLKSDANGRAVAIASSGTDLQRYGARAEESGSANEKIRVQVIIGSERPAIS